MKKEYDFWIAKALGQLEYLKGLHVSNFIIREEILKSQEAYFWNEQRRLLLELLLYEYSDYRDGVFADECPV